MSLKITLSQFSKIIKKEYALLNKQNIKKFNTCTSLIKLLDEIELITEEIDNSAKVRYWDYSSIILKNFELFHELLISTEFFISNYNSEENSIKKYAKYLVSGRIN